MTEQQKRIECRMFIKVCMTCMNEASVPNSHRPAVFLYGEMCDLCHSTGTCYHLNEFQMNKIIDMD
jgi:hypothetical protein